MAIKANISADQSTGLVTVKVSRENLALIMACNMTKDDAEAFVKDLLKVASEID